MNALEDKREVEEAASPWRDRERWLAASRPIAIDDDPDWDRDVRDSPPYERAA